MKRHTLLLSVITCAVLCAPIAHAQTKAQHKQAGEKHSQAQLPVWKNDVTRIIPFDESAWNKNVETTLIMMIAKAVDRGEIATYSNFDYDFTTRLTKTEFDNMITSKNDTVRVTNPITGQEEMKVIHIDFNPFAITKYKILEHWVFNRSEGKTELQTIGIAPARELYNEDGSFRATQSMFWLKYNDMKGILAQYEKAHPENNLTQYTWNDYFTSWKDGAQQQNPAKIAPHAGTRKTLVSRVVDIGAMPEDDSRHHLHLVNPETTVLEMAVNAAKAGKIDLYSRINNSFTIKLARGDIDKLLRGKADTERVVDPVMDKLTQW